MKRGKRISLPLRNSLSQNFPGSWTLAAGGAFLTGTLQKLENAEKLEFKQAYRHERGGFSGEKSCVFVFIYFYFLK
jgi:hypothetical protein